MEKSAFNTTLAHGPGHAGVKENGLGEKSANAKLLKSVTTQGVVSGRATGGSAVAVFAEPITNPGGGMGCAERAVAANTMQAAANIFAEDNRLDGTAGAQGTDMTTSKDEGQILISSSKLGQTGRLPKSGCGKLNENPDEQRQSSLRAPLPILNCRLKLEHLGRP